jgi:hypothetical protein
MKAIKSNGEIKTFGKLPSNVIINGVHYLSISESEASALGFKDVVIPTYDSRIEKLGSVIEQGDGFTYEVTDINFPETLADLKAAKIKNVKSIFNVAIGKTDWHRLRALDEGTTVAQDIIDERAALRVQSNDLEAQINALTTKKEVVTFDLPNLI